MARVQAGDKAPDFSLPSNTSETIRLSNFLGKKNVVIFFYPIDESPVCSREAEAFRDKYEEFICNMYDDNYRSVNLIFPEQIFRQFDY